MAEESCREDLGIIGDNGVIMGEKIWELVEIVVGDLLSLSIY